MGAYFRKPRTANIYFPALKPRELTRWRGHWHVVLTWLGPTWRSSPVRRIVQSVCLVLFLDAFFRVCWPYSEQFSATTLSDKEWFPVDTFLLIDPLVGVSTALAGKVLNWTTFTWTAGIVLICLLVPRAFCGYICPLGTLIDLFDSLVGRHFRRFHRPHVGSTRPWWMQIRFYLLAGVLAASAGGVLLAGFVSAIPVLTRGLLFTGGRWQLHMLKGANHLLPADGTMYLSVLLFAGTFLLSLLGTRFWCRYVCPSGALLSCISQFGIGATQGYRCVHRLWQVCRDLSVRCCPGGFHDSHGRLHVLSIVWWHLPGTCGQVRDAMEPRWARSVGLRPSAPRRTISRRGLLVATVAGAAAAVPQLVGGTPQYADRPRPIRPPGSVPEENFLALCIRCGECFKVCPGPVLHPAGLEYGFASLWTPVAHPEHAGCHQDCNFCTQVCPTGAIEPLELPAKRRIHMGLARIDASTCLPLRNDKLRQDCELCYERMSASWL